MKEKNLSLALLIAGGFYFVSSIITLTQWIPAMKNSELNLLSDYFVAAIIFMILFSLFSIILSFKTSSMLKKEQHLPQSYINKMKICLFTILIIFPIIWLINKSCMYNKMFNEMEEIDKRHSIDLIDK